VSTLAGSRFVGLNQGERVEVYPEERFEVNHQKSTSPDQRRDEGGDLLKGNPGMLDKWKSPSREDDFLQGHATSGVLEKRSLSRRLAPFPLGNMFLPLSRDGNP